MSNFACGYVGVIGQTNVGKSTLVNRLVGEKVAIVSPKSQTSRDNTLGIYNDDNSQIIFIDTPGLHKENYKIDAYMQKRVASSYKTADVLIFMLDAKKDLIEQYQNLNLKSQLPKILLINKIDETTFERLYPQLDLLMKESAIKEILPISALSGKNCEVLLEKIKEFLPKYEQEMRFYPREQFTDKTERELVAELIREKALLLFNEEVPHGLAIVINSFVEDEKCDRISADIICEKQSHKGILLGHGGVAIKNLSTKSRLAIEKLLDKKVFLELFVKVKENWRNDITSLKNYGFDKSDSE